MSIIRKRKVTEDQVGDENIAITPNTWNIIKDVFIGEEYWRDRQKT